MVKKRIETRLFHGEDAALRLAELGLSLANVQEVVLSGEQARAEATQHDPIGAAGWDAYRYRVRAFRDRYVQQGWVVDRSGGVEKTWSPDRKHVVITRAGIGGVGDRSAFPQPKSKPGREVRAVVDDASLLLDPSWMNVSDDCDEPDEFATWLLLVSREDDVVQSELSSPSGFTDDYTIRGWHERILLPKIDLTNPPDVDSAQTADEIDVPVVRKR